MCFASLVAIGVTPNKYIPRFGGGLGGAQDCSGLDFHLQGPALVEGVGVRVFWGKGFFEGGGRRTFQTALTFLLFGLSEIPTHFCISRARRVE